MLLKRRKTCCKVSGLHRLEEEEESNRGPTAFHPPTASEGDRECPRITNSHELATLLMNLPNVLFTIYLKRFNCEEFKNSILLIILALL